MSEIIPAILPKSVEDLREKADGLPKEAALFHFDVLEDDIWADPERAFEAHLMVREPGEIAERWADRGAKRIIAHKLDERITALRGRVEIGLGVEMHIPLEEVFPLVPQVDFVQLMSIAEIGAQGHPLDEKIFDRMKELQAKFPHIVISLDGGINVSNYHALLEAGADRLVVGSGFKDLWGKIKTN